MPRWRVQRENKAMLMCSYPYVHFLPRFVPVEPSSTTPLWEGVVRLRAHSVRAVRHIRRGRPIAFQCNVLYSSKRARCWRACACMHSEVVVHHFVGFGRASSSARAGTCTHSLCICGRTAEVHGGRQLRQALNSNVPDDAWALLGTVLVQPVSSDPFRASIG